MKRCMLIVGEESGEESVSGLNKLTYLTWEAKD